MIATLVAMLWSPGFTPGLPRPIPCSSPEIPDGRIGELRREGEWSYPAQLPFSRVSALVRVGRDWFVGGMQGIYRGNPGAWKELDGRSVRTMASDAKAIWVLFGDGSVDKLDVSANRLYYDVFAGVARRPWVSCLRRGEGAILFGGRGGWIERSPSSLQESYPGALEGQVVTAILADRGAIWAGTQRKGLFRIQGDKVQRFGFAAGLPDSWVRALWPLHGEGIVVGLANGGLVTVKSGSVATLPCPASRILELSMFRGRLVVGAHEGTWIQNGSDWQRLGTEETTALIPLQDRLGVASPDGIAWWR